MAETSLGAEASDLDSSESPFFAANMAAFREHAPQLHARLAQVRATHSRLFIDENGEIDIILGDLRFYSEDAVAYTQRQIDAYFEAPKRRFIDDLLFDGEVGLESRYKLALSAVLEAESVNLAERRVDQASHFTIVLGLGLGLHLDPLIAYTSCVELIIVEPNFDNLYHSLFVIDWCALFEQAALDGRAIHVVIEKDQASISSHLRKLISLGNPALIDGLYVYQHYESGLLKETHQAFHRELSLHIQGLGFFEDELVMMANAVGNLKKQNIRILSSQQLPREEPVFICGSGPSIDGDLDVIAAQRDRAIVVSIGSGLRTLLAHDIRPDMHVETENHPTNAANIERAAAEFGLSGIILLGAVTVQPIVTELFDEVFLYFRDSQVPSAIFGEGIDKMGTSGPTVANAALVTLTHLGFREIYLFGVDMGSRQADHYHSANTYIGIGENEEWAGSARLPVPANFGGQAHTETILGWSRSAVEHVLKNNKGIHCVNCSDGARIAGTIPMLPWVLDLQNQPVDNSQIMDEIRGKMSIFPLELTQRIWHESELAPVTKEIFAKIDTMLASAAALDDPDLKWVYDLYDLLVEAKANSAAIGAYLFGTTCMTIGSFWWFDGRIEDAQIRRRFRGIAAQELRALYSDMERRLSILISDVGDCITGQITTINSELDV
ncbi:MAG: motility associated factor glycosyltransferase family protein [Alphaproteobacteria bacterium]|nr:motility associated factor glycosyltransferase family protein [Alphaproteobacteria bacterium]